MLVRVQSWAPFVDDMSPKNIWILCPSSNGPIGGTKILYRHVDALNSLGLKASIVHAKKRFRLDWFANDTSARHPQSYFQSKHLLHLQ